MFGDGSREHKNKFVGHEVHPLVFSEYWCDIIF